MTAFVDEALVFGCAGAELVGIVARPDVPAACGVLIVVGGPQYRVGSHRQFALLARRLAGAGYAVMRFDYRGMGDSSGEQRDFVTVSEDIAAAAAALQTQCPEVKRVVLWGLCDAASAALIYCHERQDSRIAGLCLLNPWVRSDVSLAKTQVKHYYGQRLLQPEFWRKLLSGKVNVSGSVNELLGKLRLTAAKQGRIGSVEPFQSRMALGLRDFSGPVLLVLSGQDYTAKEFLEYAGTDQAWAGLLAKPTVRRHDIPEADHTFSSARFREEVEVATLDWLKGITNT
jgi:exosortase A-associated hydrolase 1